MSVTFRRLRIRWGLVTAIATYGRCDTWVNNAGAASSVTIADTGYTGRGKMGGWSRQSPTSTRHR
ncbi:hypothetical protein [Williamsia soli]|uniref:hypothetical protein n=1 Tax=Williamsia soli TaxID=364929 RepID=UPI001A9D9464|nr:hypothetical protein [Williamsia soli]